jgi:quercetin dioxygenase-like cupin family protein
MNVDLKTPKTHKVWGYEQTIVNGAYCGKRMFLREGFRCSIHHHRLKDETFYVVSGRMLLEVGMDPEILEKIVLETGDRFTLEPGMWHRFTGIEDTTFFEFSTKDRASDSIRHTQSEKVPDNEWPVV